MMLSLVTALAPLLSAALLSPAYAGDDTAVIGVTENHHAEVHAAIEALGGEPGRCYHSAGVCVARFVGAPPVAALAALPGVRYAEVDTEMALNGVEAPELPERPELDAPPTDAQGTAECPDLWELALLGVEDLPVDGTDAPVVAIQDSGFLLSHVELQGRISGQYDYGDGDRIPELSWSSTVPAHGSFIGGVIAGDPDNGVIRSGLAPHGRLNLQKIADSSGALYYSYAISAMADIAEGDLGVRVLNYSIASSNPSQGFTDAVEALGDADILVVAAAGNCSSANCWDADNDQHALYPSSYSFDHVVSVAGSLRDDGYNTYSHYGRSSVDVAAPGVDLCSLGAYSDTDYYTSSGTSYATPLVAAAAALILELHPSLTAGEVARVLRVSAEPAPEWAERVRSGGRLDVADALRVAVPRLTAPADLSFDGEGQLSLQLSNVGAEGEATLVVFHGEALELSAPEGWTLRRFGPGDSVALPDAGTWTSTGRGSVLAGAVGEHSAEAVVIGLRGLEEGASPVSVRVAFSSEGADYLNAPYQDGSADPTGFLAYSLTVDVTEAWVEPVDTSPPDDSGADDSGGDSAADDSGADDSAPWDSSNDSGGEPDDGGGCGCASTSKGSGGAGALLLLIGLTAIRRRRGR